MAGVKLPYKVKDCELVAYNVSKYFIEKGYSTNVKKIENDGYCVYIYQESFLKNIIGTPVVIKASFFSLGEETGIEVVSTFVEINAGNIIKETLSTALLLPGIIKLANITKLKKEVKKRALIETQKLKKEG